MQVIAPEGFEKHAVSENIYAGTAMGRRASYQYGTMLEASETGALAIGIGMGQSRGSTSYISPTLEITEKPVRSILLMEWKLNFSLLRVPKHGRDELLIDRKCFVDG